MPAPGEPKLVVMKPFRAIHFDAARVEDLAGVTAPPYDILTPDDRERLARSTHNIVHVTLPSGEGDAKYEVAANLLAKWRKEGVLTRRDEAGFWCYRESYEAAGKRHTMTGLFGALRLDPEYQEVLPHERTHSAPKADRLQLMRATLMDTEPIHLLYEDPQEQVNGILREATGGFEAPAIAFTDERGWMHELWPVEAPAAVAALEKAFSSRKLYIADGHHRYQTACDFAVEMRQLTGAGSRVEPFDHKMVVVANIADAGLTVHPTHRLLQRLGVKREEAQKRLAELAEVSSHKLNGSGPERGAQAMRLVSDARGDAQYAFGFYWGHGKFDLAVVASDRVPYDELAGSETLRRLDVTVLHKLVLPRVLDLDDRNAEEHIRYTREEPEAISWVDHKRSAAAVLMNPTRLDEVRKVAEAGEHMPQKSTYFMPKLRSGLLLNPLKEHWRSGRSDGG